MRSLKYLTGIYLTSIISVWQIQILEFQIFDLELYSGWISSRLYARMLLTSDAAEAGSPLGPLVSGDE